MLVWNQYDFIEYVRVIPEVGEYDTYHIFKVEKDELKLCVTIWQYDGDASIELYKNDLAEPLFTMKIIDCPGARLVKGKKDYGDCLELAASKAFGSRYDGESLMPIGIRIFVDPQIRIELFSYLNSI